MWTVLFPGDAHKSIIASSGCGFNARTQRIDGKFCSNPKPDGKCCSSNDGEFNELSRTLTPMPLKM